MFEKLKTHILESFTQEENRFFNDSIISIKNKKNIHPIVPGVIFVTKDGNNVIIVATKGIPFRYNTHHKESLSYAKYIAIAYTDVDEQGNLPKFEELSESDFRKTFYCYIV